MGISLIIGPMFSGKTTKLICQMSKLSYSINNKVLFIKYDKDIRNNKSIISHNKIYNPDVHVLLTNKLKDVNDYIKNNKITHIGIDEGQFFEDIEYVLQWSLYVNIYIATLDSDYKQIVFGNIISLIPFCDKIKKLKATCSKCNKVNSAIISTRINEKINSRIFIGGSDDYQVLCNTCFINSK